MRSIDRDPPLRYGLLGALRGRPPSPGGPATLDPTLARVAWVAGVCAALLGALGFVAWLGPRALFDLLLAGSERVPISPNTALAIVALGLAIALPAGGDGSRRTAGARRALAVSAIVLAALTLLDNLTGHALRIDHWLVAPARLTCPRGDGHMSPITAALLLAAGAGILVAGSVRGGAVAAWTGLLEVAVGWTVVTGYVADAPLFYGGPTIPLALPTGLGVALLGVGLLARVGTRAWPLSLLEGASSRALLLRLGLPWLLAVLVAFEVAVAVAFRVSGPLRAYAFAGVLVVATILDLVLMVRLAGWVGAAIDAMNRQQQRLAERLLYRKKLEAVGTIASGAAHEINNPLQQIMSSAEVIVEAVPGDPHIPIHARQILAATQRAAAVTHRLLAHARVDESPLVPVRLSDLVAEVLALDARNLSRGGVAVNVAVPVDLPPVPCRRGPLSQALLGLVVNAREALEARTPGRTDPKTLDVTATRVEDDGLRRVRLTLADRGCGMAADVCERAIEPFYTTRERDRASGLGLWVADAVVRELGGTLELESTPGEGTRVQVELPLGPAPTA